MKSSLCILGALSVLGCGGAEFEAAPDDTQGAGELVEAAAGDDGAADSGTFGISPDASGAETSYDAASERAHELDAHALDASTPDTSGPPDTGTTRDVFVEEPPPPPPPCGPSTCAGCCTAGSCSTANSAGLCGLGGGACQSCVGQCIYANLNGILCCRGDGTCGCEIGSTCH